MKEALSSDLFEKRSSEAQTPSEKLQPRELQLLVLNKCILPEERESFLKKALTQANRSNAESDFSSILNPVCMEQRTTPYLSKLLETAAWQNQTIAFDRLVKTVQHTKTSLPENTYELVAECGQPEKLKSLLRKTSHGLSPERQEELKDLAKAQKKAIKRYSTLPLHKRQKKLEAAARLSANEIRYIQHLGRFHRLLLFIPNLNATENKRKVIALLQTPDIDVNARIHDGLTLLHLAARAGNAETVNALLQVPGINVNAANHFGNTPLHRAATFGYTETVSELLKVQDIDVNATNKYGDTALLVAALNGKAETVNALLQTPGINVNAANDKGLTPLYVAARAEYVDIENAIRQAMQDNRVQP
jgi:hypothetical protein